MNIFFPKNFAHFIDSNDVDVLQVILQKKCKKWNNENKTKHTAN